MHPTLLVKVSLGLSLFQSLLSSDVLTIQQVLSFEEWCAYFSLNDI